MIVLPIEIPQVQTSNLANRILLQAENKTNRRELLMHKKKTKEIFIFLKGLQ